MELSIVIPVHNEAGALASLLPELQEVLDGLGLSYEVLVIDDGSRDETWAVIEKFTQQWQALTGLQLRKQVGQTAALQSGFDYAKGEIIVTLDGDGQNDPHDIPNLLAKLTEGYDLVSGWRHNRQDAAFSRRLPSRLANGLIRFWTGSQLHDQGCALKVFRKEMLSGMTIFGDQHRYLAALLEGLGARVAEIPVHHRPRVTGQSHYGWGRIPRVMLDLLFLKYILSYSHRPLHLFGGAGLLSLFLGILACAHVTYAKFIHHLPAADRPLLLMGVLLILVGVVLISLGILAELLVRGYHRINGISSYSIRKVVGKESALPSSIPTSNPGNAVSAWGASPHR
jgi:glycosyltransferase involved in cell wall biosynthesis